VDNLTASGVNPCTGAAEKLRCDTIDVLLELLAFMNEKLKVKFAFLKADIDSAFRRVPLRPEHRRFAHVAFKTADGPMISGHYAMPFGAVASVHAWDRIGTCLCAIARRILFLPLLRYVDDYFAAESVACAEHALSVFARLVKACLGDGAVAAHKLDVGNPLVILGVVVSLNRDGMWFVFTMVRMSFISCVHGGFDRHFSVAVARQGHEMDVEYRCGHQLVAFVWGRGQQT